MVLEKKMDSCPLCDMNDWQFLFQARDDIWLIEGVFSVVSCKVCGLVCVNPKPNYEEMKKFYPPIFFNRPFGSQELNVEYQKQLNFVFQKRYDPISRLKTKGRVLEVGCGDGYFLKYLKRKGWQEQGVEPSSYAAEYAQGTLGLNVFVGTLDQFDAQGQLFDMICLFEVFEHLHAPITFLNRAKNLLDKNGILVMTVPNYASFQRVLFGKSWHILDIPRHLFHYTPATLKGILKKAGFEPEVLSSTSQINHRDITHGYSQSLRYWLRARSLYRSRKEEVCKVQSQDSPPPPAPKPLWKRLLHASETISFFPLAWGMDRMGRGDNLHVCAKKRD